MKTPFCSSRASGCLGRLAVLLTLLVMLAACNTAPKHDPAYSSVAPPAIPSAPQGDGSIYHAGFERSWFESVRARRVGDILLVNLIEETEASHSNSGSVTRDSSSSITNPTLFGRALSFTLPGHSEAFNLGQSLESGTAFSGDADNTQENAFSGSISVTVTDVLANGYLRVRGEKRIGMTGGNEYIRVSGIVRPEDIDPANTVDSTRIADATLVYVGDGQTSMATRMGWLAKFFISGLMPF
jgi:flagellar L-ring protein precursor FlgH